jgi:predicted Holliday junction resolvase-like endonuclease
MDKSRNSQLCATELKWNANQQEGKIKDQATYHIVKVVVGLLFAIALLAVIFFLLTKNRIGKFQREIDSTKSELEIILRNLEQERLSFESERQDFISQIEEKDSELAEVNKRKRQLEIKPNSSNKQNEIVIKHRLVALNELYLGVKIEVSSNGKRRIKPLMEALKDLINKKNIQRTPPSKVFWDNLRLSVEGEYPGIIAHVEKNYPQLTERDLQLFLLMCAKFPNRIISFCMDYTGDATASKRKTHLLKEKMGMDMKIDQFLDLFVNDGKRG